MTNARVRINLSPTVPAYLEHFLATKVREAQIDNLEGAVVELKEWTQKYEKAIKQLKQPKPVMDPALVRQLIAALRADPSILETIKKELAA
jgi:hypothetical protein